MNVLVIPEDFRKDQHILKPLFTRLFRHLGIPSVKIEILRNPLLGGVTEATKSDKLQQIVDRRQGMFDLFVLCVDRDGQVGRRDRLDDIEREFGPAFLAANAWEELETWALAGLDLLSGWRWEDVRAEIHVKEQYFELLAAQRGLSNNPDGGRKALANEASRNIPAIRQKCPEDFDHLAQRVQAIASAP